MIPRWQVDNVGTKRKSTSFPKWTAAVIVISLATIAFVLQASFLPPIDTQLAGPAAENAPHVSLPGIAVSNQEKFILHPQDHASRDATNFTHHWRITSGDRRPDGVLKRVYLINDEFPGPTIEARSGDRLIIIVENALDNEGLAMHWHGLTMRDFNAMDGAVGITQEPIKVGESFTYDFVIDIEQHGTFWYHAHEGVQRADGLYGGLVVHQPAAKDAEFAEEHLLLVGDHYHRSAAEALEFYSHPGAFGLETVPDSILVNGQGAFDCSRAVPARPLDCREHDISALLFMERTKRNVVRVVNVGAYAGLSLEFNDSVITPIALDGGHEVRGNRSHTMGMLYPGERIDVLVEAGTNGGASSLVVALNDKPFKYENPSLVSTQTFPISWTGDHDNEGVTAAAVDFFDLQKAKSFHDQSATISKSADVTVVLYAVTQKLAHLDNVPLGFINRTTWRQPEVSEPLISTDRSTWNTKDTFVPQLPYNANSPTWVDIVLNNLDEEGHPFHMHGYSFYVLSTYTSEYNWGSYNPFEDAEPPGGQYDTSLARKKDTVFVPRRGYAVLRMKVDNPGLWAFHCHVLWHMGSGMSMAFDVR